MSTIDKGVRALLTPLILGQPAIITPATAKIISTWIAMKLMVAEHSHPEDVSTQQAERDYLRQRREVIE
jgi:hypothetical protein